MGFFTGRVRVYTVVADAWKGGRGSKNFPSLGVESVLIIFFLYLVTEFSYNPIEAWRDSPALMEIGGEVVEKMEVHVIASDYKGAKS